jgi:hypothetical protein
MTRGQMQHPKLTRRTYPADSTVTRDSQRQMPRSMANPQSKIRNPRSIRTWWLAWAGGLLSQVLGRRRLPVTTGDLGKNDYRTSTQRMGVRFSERIRDTFRFRWLRKMS